MNPIRVISRHSNLAMMQVKEIFNQLPNIPFTYAVCKSFGDKHKNRSLMDKSLPSDFFTKELDESILYAEADVAIHSAKDLPYPLSNDLEVIALTVKKDGSDALVTRKGLSFRLENIPRGSVIGTSSINRKRELLNYRPDLEIKSIRGTIEERIAQVDKGDYDAVIVATCALQRLGLDERIDDILPFMTHPLQGCLAIVARKERDDMRDIFGKLDIRSQFGKVYITGFGPGHPELLTIRAQRRISEADIIYYDDLLDKEFLDQYRAEKIYVGKRKNIHSIEQEDINLLLLQSAYDGKVVVRLKGGDPMIFAHGGEEVEFLQSNLIDVEVIPGISTANALASLCKIPLTHRDIASTVAFASGHAPRGVQVPDADTLVYYMAGTKIKSIAAQIIAKGWNPQTPVALIHNVSLSDQKEFFYTLKELTCSDFMFPTPIITIVGEVVNLRFKRAREVVSRKINRVLFTGLDSSQYKHLGEIIHTPLISIEPLLDSSALETAIKNLRDFEHLVFTSKNTVYYFFEALFRLSLDSRFLAHLQIYSIGKTTSSALLRYGIVADEVAFPEDSEGMIQLFEDKEAKGKILIPRSDKALGIIPSGLKKTGLDVYTVEAYRNVMPTDIDKIDLTKIDSIVFTSPSCVDNFCTIYGSIPTDKSIVVKGCTTYKHLMKLGYPEINVQFFDDTFSHQEER